MVKDVIQNTKININKAKVKNINNIYNADIPLVSFSAEMIKFDLSIKNFLKNKMYFNLNVLKKTNKGKKIINFLFKKIKKNPKKFLKNMNNNNVERRISDFIAGMTDRYAINLYNDLK